MTVPGRSFALPALLAGVLLAAPVAAASLEFEAHDLRKCLEWSIKPATQADRSPGYRAARARARPGFEVFAADADLAEGGALRKFGACSYRRVAGKPRLGCVPGLDFPLAGANYVAGDGQRARSFILLKCTTGCDQKLPDTVYEITGKQPADPAAQDKEDRDRSYRFRHACRSR
jgi:hypothetical protein